MSYRFDKRGDEMSALDRPAGTRASGRGVASGAAPEQADILGREAFVVQAVSVGAETILKLSGELDMASARLLGTEVEAVFESGANRVILDISELTFIDTSGTKTLLDTLEASRETPGRLTIRGAQGLVRGRRTRLNHPRRSVDTHRATG
jgi:anti-anti-sigma factor